MVREHVIAFGDLYGTRCAVEPQPPEEDGDLPTVRIEVGSGLSGGRGYVTPVIARQIAAVLMEAADDAEA